MIKIKSLFYCLFIITLITSACGGNINSKNDKKDDSLHPAEWRLGIALYSFNRFSFVDAIAKADSAGVKYVEGFSFHKLGKEFGDQDMSALTDENISTMQQILKDKGIEMQSMYVSGAKNVEDWKHYFNLAKKFNMKFLVSEPEKKDWDMLDSLAGVYQIKVAIHEHAKEKSAYWHPDSVLAAIKNHPNFGACADVGHWTRSGLNPVECLKQLEGHILGLHIKDLKESNNPETEDVTIGTGVIDYPAIVAELKRQQFRGDVHIECEHKMENNLADVIAGVKYFEGLYKQGK